MGFSFRAEGIKVSIATDLGYIPDSVRVHLRGSDVLMLESNHDLDMLKVGPYPWSVKQRVMGRMGHLSNDAASGFLREDLDSRTSTLILGHLSEHNNHPVLVQQAAQTALGERGPGSHRRRSPSRARRSKRSATDSSRRALRAQRSSIIMPNILDQRLERIAAKLDHLRELDSEFTLFASDSHEYQLGAPLSEDEIRELEETLGVTLPADYRAFVGKVGYGGAGPFYGLFRFEDEDEEDLTDLDLITKPFRWTEATNPYDWEDPCSQEDVHCEELEVGADDEGEEDEGDGEDGLFIVQQIPGALYICNYGCAIRFFLVVQGQSAGEVWGDWQTDKKGIVPERDAEGRHLGFLDWYERWLDESIAKMLSR